MNKYIIIKILGVLIASFSQILLKISANKKYDRMVKEYLNPYVIIAYFLFFISMLIGIYSLKGMKISFSVAIESLSYILIPLLSRFYFKEKINIEQATALTIIVIGVVVYNL